jgi:hypothetical protein
LAQPTLVLLVSAVVSANVNCASNGHFPVEQPADTNGAKAVLVPEGLLRF